MNHVTAECSATSRMFPVKWPLTKKNVRSTSTLGKHKGKLKRIKKRNNCRGRLVTKRRRTDFEQASITEEGTQIGVGGRSHRLETDVVGVKVEVGTSEVCADVTKDVICEPEVPCGGNIFECLNQDEAIWLADEVHQANKKVFRADKAAEKLKKGDGNLKERKESFDAIKNLLKDLRWNIKYPNEETAPDLETLNEVSNNFGVRNMVNYLGLLDGYFSQVQTELEK